MPHLTARVPEAQLAGREPALITALTDAVAQVYGEWARGVVVVHLVLGEQTRAGTSVELIPTPDGRAGLGGVISR